MRRSDPRPVSQMLSLAACQHALIARSQAHALSVTSRQLAALERSNVLERRAEHVFAVSGAPMTTHQAILEAVLAGAGRAVAGGRTAAALHGFDGYRLDGQSVELLLFERGRAFSWPGATLHYSSRIASCEIVVVDSIACTDPIRTWFMLCSIESPGRAEEILDGAERDGLIDREAAHDRLEQWREMGRNGVTVAAAILGRREQVAHTPQSVLERRLLRLVARAGLVAPECQYPVRRADGRMAYVDVAWPDLRYGAEADGHVAHATRAQRRSDNQRQNALLAGGFELSRFTWEEITHEAAYVQRTLRDTIRARAQRLGLDPRAFFLSDDRMRSSGRTSARKGRHRRK